MQAIAVTIDRGDVEAEGMLIMHRGKLVGLITRPGWSPDDPWQIESHYCGSARSAARFASIEEALDWFAGH